MSAPARELVASINGRQVGILRDAANVWSFEYTREWIDSPDSFDLAPNLPRAGGTILDGASERPVQWFFDNLLPEEQARDVLAKEASISASDAFGLIAFYGKESAGAITLMAPGEAPAESGYRELTDEALHERIIKLPKQSLTANAPKHMSNAGAQHKLAVCVRDGRLFEPVGRTPSTHLLRPDHLDRETCPYSVANEYFSMRLADALGLNVPPVQIRYVPDPVYLIERFDRRTERDDTLRLHVVDACQLLGLDRTFKYQQTRVENLLRCIDACTNRARARQDILAWTLFNVLIGNADAHLKNLSFHVSRNRIELAPFYDLVSTEISRTGPDNARRWPDCDLTMPIGGAKTFATVNRDSFLAFASQLGVTPTAARRLLDSFAENIDPAAAQLYAEVERHKVPRPVEREGQLRVLRSIRYMIIRDMQKQFSRTTAT